ncbi:hypothetical protein M9458_050314, partial [Cirrhinus mrigala]
QLLLASLEGSHDCEERLIGLSAAVKAGESRAVSLSGLKTPRCSRVKAHSGKRE